MKPWTRDYAIGKMKSWGLETSVREYSVWIPDAATAGGISDLTNRFAAVTRETESARTLLGAN